MAANQTPPAPGVIATIADGFSTALWRPVVVVVPVALDLYYWLGWKIELGSFAVALRQWLIDAGMSRTDENLVRVARFSQWDASTTPSYLFVPSLLAGADPTRYYDPRTRPTFSTGSWGFDVALMAVLVVIGVLLLTVFLVMLTDAVFDRAPRIGVRVRTIGRVWARLMGAVGLAALTAAGMFGPLMGAWVAFSSSSRADLGPLFDLIGFILMNVLFVMFLFVPEAIVMSDIGPVEAIRRSFAIVREFFWQSLCFVAVFVIMSLGLGDLCLRLAGNAPGLLIGIVANAFFSSGLAIASLLFYNSRIQRSRYATRASGSAKSRALR